jgi:hypothetical protein
MSVMPAREAASTRPRPRRILRDDSLMGLLHVGET